MAGFASSPWSEVREKSEEIFDGSLGEIPSFVRHAIVS